MLAIFSPQVIWAQERETVPLKPKYRTLRLIITVECASCRTPTAQLHCPCTARHQRRQVPRMRIARLGRRQGTHPRDLGAPSLPPTVGRTGGGGPNNRSPAAEGGCGGRHAAGGCDADAPACHARGWEGGGGGTGDAVRSVVHHQYAKRFF